MKKKKNDTERVCAYCEYSVPAPDDGSGDEYVICSKRGLISAGKVCRRFKYDLLKREPIARADLPEIEKIDI